MCMQMHVEARGQPWVSFLEIFVFFFFFFLRFVFVYVCYAFLTTESPLSPKDALHTYFVCVCVFVWCFIDMELTGMVRLARDLSCFHRPSARIKVMCCLAWIFFFFFFFGWVLGFKFSFQVGSRATSAARPPLLESRAGEEKGKLVPSHMVTWLPCICK